MGPSGQRRAALVALALVLALGLLTVAVALASERAEGPRVTTLIFPAKLVQHVENPAVDGGTSGDGWKQPSAAAILEESRFVLDTGNNRILALDEAGTAGGALDREADERLALHEPMAIASDDEYLYVANSGASEVLVLQPSGRVVKVLTLEKVDPKDEAPPRPIGLAVTRNGDLFVSDGDNHRVLRYDGNGRLLQAIGNGKRDGGLTGFNTPAGLALGPMDTIYVVDILNGRVVRLSPDGEFLGQLGRLGDTSGTFSRPKDVAVDQASNVYVSDGLQASVQVFSPQGEYLGLIGRENPGDRNSVSLFQAPAGLTISQDKLYVVDRFAGLFVFQLPNQQ
jgi:DNA-binding beta-propeller fold protein YncE